MAATFSGIEDAFLYVSSESYGTNEAYLSLDTGQIYYVSNLGDSDDLPDGFEESNRHIEVPHKNDLGLGRSLVDEFTAANAPQLAGDVSAIFRHRGAYGKFKSLLERNALLEQWFEFENRREMAAIKKWCRENDIDLEIEADA